MLLKFNNVSFSYENGDSILDDVSFQLKQGELTVIEGKSGSGKSTFLHIAGLIAFPQNGYVTFLDQNISSTSKKLFLLRREIGYIFQSHMLWKDLSVIENVAMPLILQGISRKEAYPIAQTWLEKVELGTHANISVMKISGGEQQRVGLARAFVHNPKLILADEVTGNLDEETGNKVMNLCVKIARENKISIICVTHNKAWNNMFDSEYYFKNSKLNLVRKS